jgi:hypothetical protein
MARPTEDDQTPFIWVNSTTSRIPGDAATRTKIRRQAMRNMALERKRAPRPRNSNTRQYPIFLSDTVVIDPDPSVSHVPVHDTRPEELASNRSRQVVKSVRNLRETQTILSTFSNAEDLLVNFSILQSHSATVEYTFRLTELFELSTQPCKVSNLMGRNRRLV